MAIPVSFSELSTTASSNPPADSEGVSQGDDQFRAVYAFIRSLYEGSSGGQLVFPATQNASVNANTLDDYEEGSWTPTDASGAGLSLTASGYYVKVGKLVYVKGVAVYPATASGAAAVLGGLPFTSVSDSLQASLAIGFSGTASAARMLVNPNATTINVYTTTGAATNAQLTGATVYFAGSYIASA